MQTHATSISSIAFTLWRKTTMKPKSKPWPRRESTIPSKVLRTKTIDRRKSSTSSLKPIIKYKRPKREPPWKKSRRIRHSGPCKLIKGRRLNLSRGTQRSMLLLAHLWTSSRSLMIGTHLRSLSSQRPGLSLRRAGKPWEPRESLSILRLQHIEALLAKISEFKISIHIPSKMQLVPLKTSSTRKRPKLWLETPSSSRWNTIKWKRKFRGPLT